MPARRFTEPAGELMHINRTIGASVQRIGSCRKAQRLLDSPNRIVLVRRKDASGVTHCNPPDRNRRALRNDGLQVYDCIDADLRPFANDGEVEYPCARGQEDLVFDGAAEECGVRADEYSIANLNRVLGGGADYRVVAHDDLLTKRDGLTLGNEARTVPDHTAGSDPYLADECRVRCDDRRGVNAWAMATALQQHWNTTSISCPSLARFADV